MPWESAANLRKHAKCHIAKDSLDPIQSAGKGGRKPIILLDMLVDTQYISRNTLTN